jgi:phosphoketolase
MDAAIKYCTAGLGIWEWASNDQGSDPDVVMACAGDVIDRVPDLGSRAAYAKQYIRDKLTDHKIYIHRYGQDMPEIRDWRWGSEGTRQPKGEQ